MSVQERFPVAGSSESSETIGSQVWEITDVAGGCFASLASIVLSCGLLIINGALVMATLATVSAAGAEWVRVQAAQQFLLFAAPVGLLIAQWMMIDYVRAVLKRE